MNDRKLKVLFVAGRMPTHLGTGDRVRAYHLLAGLARRGHQIDLLGFQDLASSGVDTDIHSICHSLQPIHMDNIEFHRRSRAKQLRDTFAGVCHGYPRRVWEFHSRTMLDTFSAMVERMYYDIVHFSGIEVAELLSVLHGKTFGAAVYDLIDAVSLSVQSSLLHRWSISWPSRLIETHQLRRFERKLLANVDAACVVSARDKAYLAPCGVNVRGVRVIPLGVQLPDRVPEHDKEFDLLFVGNMSAEPNVDAVRWFARYIWPQVVTLRPSSSFFIVGRDPTPSVLALANDRITVTGSVTDVNWFLTRAKMFIAPMRVGAGQKTKLLEAFAHALPVIATHEANEGTYAIDGQSIVLRDKPCEMARAIVELLDDAEKRRMIGRNAFRFVKQNYSWHRSAELLEDLYLGAIDRAHLNAPSSG